MKESERNAMERVVLATIVGLCTALEEQELDLAVAEQILFTPYCQRTLEGVGFGRQLTSLIHDGTELEDIESLMPERYDNAVRRIKRRALELLGRAGPATPPGESWLVGCLERDLRGDE